MATDAIVSSLAKEVRDPVVGTERAYSNERSRENKCGCCNCCILTTVGRYIP